LTSSELTLVEIQNAFIENKKTPQQEIAEIPLENEYLLISKANSNQFQKLKRF